MLRYVRKGPRSNTPVVIIPGGPGLGSVLPYQGLRRIAAQGGLDTIMVEHRGVGFSRHDTSGTPLRQDDLWVSEVIADVRAVLDSEGVRQAYFAGSSYGSYLASCFGAAHPERVAGMLLDSALQSTEDLAIERDTIRGTFWNADTTLANLIREFHARQHNPEPQLLDTLRAGYELLGAEFLEKLLLRRSAHRMSPTWATLAAYSVRDESIARIPGVYDFAIAGTIGFRELNYGAKPDGLPLDPALTYAGLAPRFPEFSGEPFQLQEHYGSFSWPLVLLSGTRDIRTPQAIAQRVCASAPHATLITIHNGHSALDTHPIAFLNALRYLVQGRQRALPGIVDRLNALPPKGVSARFPQLLRALFRLESREP